MSLLGRFLESLESLEKYVGTSNYIISFFVKLTINSLLMIFIIFLNKKLRNYLMWLKYIWQLMILNDKDLIHKYFNFEIYIEQFFLIKALKKH